MQQLPNLPVPALGGGLSAALDLVTLTQGYTLTVQFTAAAQPTDAVDLYGSNLPAAATLDQCVKVGNVGGVRGTNTTVNDGRAPTVVSPPLYRYLYCVRTSGSTGGLNLACVGQLPVNSGSVLSVGATAPITSTLGVNPVIGLTPGTFGAPSKLNKGMAALTTVADFDHACATVVAATPVGYVGARVNGVAAEVGDASRAAPCYFSSDGGATAQAQGAITTAASLYWVQSVAGFNLAAGVDIIDYVFDA